MRRRSAPSSITISRSSSIIRAQARDAALSATGPAGPWTIAAQAAEGDARTLSSQAHDLSLADLQTFDKKPPPLTAEGPVAIKLDAELAPNSTLRAFSGRFSIGAGRVRINNPDAVPFFIDEASGAIAWDEDARRFRIDRLQVLAGLTHVEMQGWMAPPTERRRSGRRISSRVTRNSVLTAGRQSGRA